MKRGGGIDIGTPARHALPFAFSYSFYYQLISYTTRLIYFSVFYGVCILKPLKWATALTPDQLEQKFQNPPHCLPLHIMYRRWLPRWTIGRAWTWIATHLVHGCVQKHTTEMIGNSKVPVRMIGGGAARIRYATLCRRNLCRIEPKAEQQAQPPQAKQMMHFPRWPLVGPKRKFHAHNWLTFYLTD